MHDAGRQSVVLEGMAQMAHNADASRARFGELIDRHRAIVFKIAGSYAYTPEDRADLAQEIATQLWRAWPSYDPGRSFTTWMYRIALNVAIGHARGDGLRRRHAVPLDDALHDIPDEGAIDHESGHELEQMLRLLQRFIARQAPLDRALMVLYLDERPQREIAEILGISETNVSTKIGRLKQRIRDEL